MTTVLQITKTGIKLVCDVDKRPRPVPRGAWPLPNFPDPVGGSLLTLALERVQQTGRMGIRVSNQGLLPGAAGAVWTLLHHAYQGGTPPTDPSWDETPVATPSFSLLLDQALPKAVHTFKLRRVEASQTTVFPQSQISTPEDATAPLTLEGILADDLVSAGAEKTTFKGSYYDPLVAEQAGLDSLADAWLCSRSAYDAAVAAVVASVAAWSPAYTVTGSDTALAAGGGATLLGLFKTAYSTRDALKTAIQTAISSGTGDVWSDDKLTAAEKVQVKQWRDDVVTEQGGTNGLDAQADKALVSRTTYDSTITALETWLGTLTGTDGWNPSTHAWRTTATYSLGTGGGATGRQKFVDVYAARTALLAAIAMAALDKGTGIETFRPKLQWDFGPSDPADFSPYGFSTSAASSPDDQTARRWAGLTVGALGRFQLFNGSSFSLAGRDGFVLQARIRLNSGTWVGKAYYTTDGSWTAYKTISAPTVGQWAIVSWDLRAMTSGAAITTLSAVIGYALELGTAAASIDVDWVAVGTYGPGSRVDYDLALQDAITDLLGRADTTVFGNTVITNSTNMFPNPTSEIAFPAGSFGAAGVTAGNAYAGSNCRSATSAGVLLTPKLQVTPGDTYYLNAWMKTTTGTGWLEPIFDSGTATGLSVSGTTYLQKSGQFTVPAGATWMQMKIRGTTGTVYVDQLVMRKAADAYLLVNGSFEAYFARISGIATNSLGIGPLLQFKSSASNPVLLQGRPDGSMSRVTAADRVINPNLGSENANDPAIYMDDTRVYPTADVMTYETRWGGTTETRGIILNMGSAFATTGLAGLLVLWAGTALNVYGAQGIGNYSASLKAATVDAATTAEDRLTVIYYPTLQKASDGTANIRMRVLVNGVSKLTMTDAELTATYNGARGGYAGLYLVGNVRVSDPKFGRGYVTIQDGAVKADVFMTTNYAEDGSGNPTQGGKIAFDGVSGDSPVGKFGPNGIQVGTAVLNQASMRVNRVHNADFSDSFWADYANTAYNMPHAWTTLPTDWSMLYARGYTGGGTYSQLIGSRISLAAGASGSKGVVISQTFDVANVAPSTVFQAHLKWKVALAVENANISAASFRMKTKLLAPDRTIYELDDSTLSSFDTGYGTSLTLTSKDYNIDSQLQAKGAGRWTLLFDCVSFGNGISGTNSGGSTATLTAYLGAVELVM